MSKVKIEIKSWLNGSVLFEYESEDATYLREANLGAANLGGSDLRGADLSGADLRDANLRDANLRDAAIYYSDIDFDADEKLRHFIQGTAIEEAETEMRHRNRTSTWGLIWKNVLRIKSWKLKAAEDITPGVEEMPNETVAQTPETTAADSKCDQGGSEVDIKVGDMVAFSVGQEYPHATSGEVVAIDEAEGRLVVSRDTMVGSQTYILKSDDVILIGSTDD